MSKLTLKRTAYVLLILLGIAAFAAVMYLNALVSDHADIRSLAVAAGAELTDEAELTPGIVRQALALWDELARTPLGEALAQKDVTLLRLYAYSDVLLWVSTIVATAGVVLLFGASGNHQRKRFDTKRVALCGVLLAMMLVLGWVEHLIPLNAGIPGIKLGLSNGVLIFAVYMLDAPTSFVLMALKVLLSCAFLGTPASMMIYGFAGGLLSLTGMLLLSKVKGLHPVTVSMVGGALHNVGQVGVAMLILNTPNLLYYMAVLMVVGLLCGLLTGVCADRVMKHMKHVKL